LIRNWKRTVDDGKGFTLLEVMVALAIVGGLLVTVIYTLNYHLGIAERHETETVAMMLGREKLSELGKEITDNKGDFEEPYSAYHYEIRVKESSYPGYPEVSVTVTNGDEKVVLKELVKR
jgi:general secretion pathway protein I